MNKTLALFLAKKLIRIATLLFAVCLISFVLVSNSPIDPVKAYVGADIALVGPEQMEQIRRYWGMDKSPAEQFINWFGALIHGDFGTSLIYRKPVLDVIAEKFLASLALMGTAWVLSGVFGFILGIIAAMKQGTWLDRLIKWYCLTLASTPVFWLGLLLLIIFSVWLQWFPIGLSVPVGVVAEEITITEKIKHLILPALTLSIVGVSNIALHTRQKLVDVLNSDFVLFAKARGEKDSAILWQHGLRNIALPALTLQFASFSELFGGAILAEQVFSYPGLGSTITQSGLRGDVPLLLGIVIFSALFVFIGNLAADTIYRLIDPRIKEGGSV